MNLLEICKRVSTKVNLGSISQVIGSKSSNAISLLDIAREELVLSADEGEWSEFYIRSTFKSYSFWRPLKLFSMGSVIIYGGFRYEVKNSGITGDVPPSHTSGSEINGDVELLYLGLSEEYPIDYIAKDIDFIVNNTIQNMSDNKTIIGNISIQQFQELKLNQYSDYDIFVRIGENIHFINELPEDTTLSLVYYTKNRVKDSNGALKEDFTQDTDTPIIPCNIIRLGMIWRFKQKSGLDYSEDYNEWEKLVKSRIGKNNIAGFIQIDSDCYGNDNNHITLIIRN